MIFKELSLIVPVSAGGAYLGFLGFILFGACIGCIEGSEDGVRQGILKGTFGCFSTIGSRFFEGACGSFRPRLDRRL